MFSMVSWDIRLKIGDLSHWVSKQFENHFHGIKIYVYYVVMLSPDVGTYDNVL